MKKLTAKDIFDAKGKRQLTELLVTTKDEARAAEEAGIDMLITMGGTMLKEVRTGAPNTFITAGLVYGDIASEQEAFKQGFQALRDSADAVYLCGSPLWVGAMAREGIPVVSHVGLIPQRSTWTGGMRAVGKTAEEAMKVYRDTLAFDSVGALGVEMEVVPHRVAAEIAKRVKLCCISMGSGPDCDAQYLFAMDILGSHRGHIPRHARVYCDIYSEMERIQKIRVKAFQSFRQDVETRAFPEAGQVVPIPEAEFEKFLNLLDKE